MKSIIGNNIQLSLFGESHGKCIGFTLNGLASGIEIDFDYIRHQLSLRRPDGVLSTSRIEEDDFEVISGYFNNATTGAPLTVLIYNKNTNSRDYTPNIIRPSSSDYTAFLKYNGFHDYRGSGMFSGRTTVALVIAGSIANQILKSKGIIVGSRVASIGDVSDDGIEVLKLDELLNKFNDDKFPVVNSSIKEEMTSLILKSKEELDSVGGVIETYVNHMPSNIGEPYFYSVESVLSHLIYSIPGVKGVSFGEGFNITKLKGSTANDSMYYIRDKVVFTSNNAGGINGGITNGNYLRINTAFRPTPSIYKAQNTIDIEAKTNVTLELKGRHDPCIAIRGRVVVDSVVALGLLDLIVEEHGKGWMR